VHPATPGSPPLSLASWLRSHRRRAVVLGLRWSNGGSSGLYGYAWTSGFQWWNPGGVLGSPAMSPMMASSAPMAAVLAWRSRVSLSPTLSSPTCRAWCVPRQGEPDSSLTPTSTALTWREHNLAMAGMSCDASPSAFTGPWCATQSVARPTDVCACVERCSRPRHGHLRYESSRGDAGVRHDGDRGERGWAWRLTRGGSGERMVVQCQFVAVKIGSSVVMSPTKKKMAKSFSSPAYSSDGVGFGSRPLPTPLLVLPLLLLVVWRGYGATSAMAWGWKARAAGRLCFYSRARLWLW
jgi:hypothetical protein